MQEKIYTDALDYLAASFQLDALERKLTGWIVNEEHPEKDFAFTVQLLSWIATEVRSDWCGKAIADWFARPSHILNNLCPIDHLRQADLFDGDLLRLALQKSEASAA